MKIEMKNPCDIKWEDLIEGNKVSKNCEKCKRKVYDFTDKTENEIANFIENKEERICGRIRSSHLKQIAGIVLFTGVLNFGCANKHMSYSNKNGRIEFKTEEIIHFEDGIVDINGFILNENLEELIFVDISLVHKNDSNNKVVIRTESDFDGSFIIKSRIPKNRYKEYFLQISYVGYEQFIIPLEKINLRNGIKIILKDAEPIMIGELILSLPEKDC